MPLSLSLSFTLSFALRRRELYDLIKVALEDALLVRPDDTDGPMLEAAHELFENVSAELRLDKELRTARRAIQHLQREHTDEQLQPAVEQLERTLRAARKVANLTRDMDLIERAASSVLREARRLLERFDAATRALNDAIQEASLLCQGELMPQSRELRTTDVDEGAKTKLRVGTAPFAKNLVSRLHAAILEAEKACVDKEELDSACEALEAVQALLVPGQGNQASFDIVARRRSSTRRASCQRASSSAGRDGTGGLDA